MLRRRDLLSALALILLSAISLAAAAQALLRVWATRHEMDRAELVAWMTERDVSSLPRAIRLRLARRFEQDFAAGHDWKQELSQLDGPQRQRLGENYFELSQTWFLEKVDRYYELPEPRRTDYVDSQIDGISRWPVLEKEGLQSGSLLWNADPGRYLPRLQSRFKHLKPDEQQRVQQFVGAVYMRWLTKGFRQLIPIAPE
jgi:hypothetical protein